MAGVFLILKHNACSRQNERLRVANRSEMVQVSKARGNSYHETVRLSTKPRDTEWREMCDRAYEEELGATTGRARPKRREMLRHEKTVLHGAGILQNGDVGTMRHNTVAQASWTVGGVEPEPAWPRPRPKTTRPKQRRAPGQNRIAPGPPARTRRKPAAATAAATVAPFEKAKMQNATMLRLAQPRGTRSAPQLVMNKPRGDLARDPSRAGLTHAATPVPIKSDVTAVLPAPAQMSPEWEASCAWAPSANQQMGI